jgi:hypothetical protein
MSHSSGAFHLFVPAAAASSTRGILGALGALHVRQGPLGLGGLEPLLGVLSLWGSGTLFHMALQASFSSWAASPLTLSPTAYLLWDPHSFEAFFSRLLLCAGLGVSCTILSFQRRVWAGHLSEGVIL